MELVTRRLVLREFTASDLPAFLAYRADERYAAFYAAADLRPETTRRLLDDFRRWAAAEPRRNYQLAIAEAGVAHVAIGCVGLRTAGRPPRDAEFGIELAPSCWGRGYAREAARALLAHGFDELRLATVGAVSVTANARVERLLRWLGFAAAGARPGPVWMAARAWTRTEWRLTRRGWTAGESLRRGAMLDAPPRVT